LALQDHCEESFKEVRRIRAEWTGPHLDPATGEAFWHCPALGQSTWGDPSAAAEFVARVAERLQQAMPTALLLRACPPKEGSKDANEEEEPGQDRCGNSGKDDESCLVGAWVYNDGACEYDICLGAEGGLQFHETHRDAERGVATRSVSGTLQPEDGWLHAALSDSAGQPQGEVRLRALAADKDAPGMFAITHPCALAASVKLALKEDVITELEIGTVVQVVEIVRHEEQHRVRAHLENPSGWISVEDTLNGHRWADRQRCMISNFRISSKQSWSADTIAHKKVDIAALVAAAETPDAFAAGLAAPAMAGQTPPRPQSARNESSPVRSVPSAPATNGHVASPPHKSQSPMKSAQEGPSMKSIEEEQLSVVAAEEESPPQSLPCGGGEVAAAATVPAADTPETAEHGKAVEHQPDPQPPSIKPAPPPPCAPPPPWVVAMANKRPEGGGAASAVATPRPPAAAGAASLLVAAASPEPTKATRTSPRPPATSPGRSPSIFLVIEEAPLDDLTFGTPLHSACKNSSSSIVPGGKLDGWEEPTQKGGDKGGSSWPSRVAGRRRWRAAAGGS